MRWDVAVGPAQHQFTVYPAWPQPEKDVFQGYILGSSPLSWKRDVCLLGLNLNIWPKRREWKNWIIYNPVQTSPTFLLNYNILCYWQERAAGSGVCVARSSRTPDVGQINGLSVETSAGLPGLLEDVLCLISSAGSLGLPSKPGTCPCSIMKAIKGSEKSKSLKESSAEMHGNGE